MNLHTRRWILAPLRQLRTYRLMRQHGPTLNYGTAWALITLRAAPHEAAIVRIWAHENPAGAPPGIHYDNWHDLPPAEHERRFAWLQRHGRSPVQLLDVEAGLIINAGLHVLDWSLPPSPSGRAPRSRSNDVPRT